MNRGALLVVFELTAESARTDKQERARTDSSDKESENNYTWKMARHFFLFSMKDSPEERNYLQHLISAASGKQTEKRKNK